MRAFEFNTNIAEAPGLGGLEYEKQVVSSVKHAISSFGDSSIKFKKLDCDSAGFCSFDVDLELEVNSKDFSVELKQNRKAQMGGTSIRYQAADDNAEIVNPDRIEEVAIPLFIGAVKSKGQDLYNFIDFISKQKPIEYNGIVGKKNVVPFACTKDAWEKSVAAGLLRPLNTVVKFDNVRSITNGYNKKGVYYIQIGGAGLFYMNENPLNLPVPAFDGECQIELRLARSGSKTLKSGLEVVGSGFRAQGRLLTQVKSDYTLDDPSKAEQILKIAVGSQPKNAKAKNTANSLATKTATAT